MFAVFWRDRPASTEGFPMLLKGQGWDQHQFATFEEAHQYMQDWMDDEDLELNPNEPFDYSGQGHFVEIRAL